MKSNTINSNHFLFFFISYWITKKSVKALPEYQDERLNERQRYAISSFLK